jgi:hypothetical protein
MQSAGRNIWAIPEDYVPGRSLSDKHDLVSHEAACFLNTNDQDADVTITLFFEDREPVGPYRMRMGARRTVHMRFNDLTDPEPVPRDTSYASLIESSGELTEPGQGRMNAGAIPNAAERPQRDHAGHRSPQCLP